MKKIIIILLVILIGCRGENSSDTQNSTNKTYDIIYSASKSNLLQSVHPTKIKITDSIGQVIDFKVNREDFIKLTVERFETYPIILSNPINVTIDSVNGTKGIFKITPTDTIFTFNVYQNYGTNNVIMAYLNDKEEITYFPYDSVRQIGVFKSTAE